MRPVDRRERGAALLTVLLLVAVISVLAGSALEKLRVSTRLAGNSAAIEQARAYAYAAETLAQIQVDQLLNRDAARTTLQGDWSGHLYPLPVPGGAATLTVTDGGNCFNLNGLVTGTPGQYVDESNQILGFARLMRFIGIPGATAQGIAAATADWIDSDQQPLPNGAEDSAYLGDDPPYRTSGTLMTDVSEMRAVAGVTPDIYRQLKPWICALPKPEPSKLNVNTLMPEQAPLFAALFPDDSIDLGQARAMLLQRPPEGFASTGDFWNQTALRSVSNTGAQAFVDVRTYWFDLSIDVALGSAELHQTALLDATQMPTQIVSREWGDPA